mmetsp:Transcript_12843/g.37698  ORF Transcript_12843/g.37698 Transcript_12843/m.37698 type:complete len:259 (+) Transcript_12843:1712-2488(+)
MSRARLFRAYSCAIRHGSISTRPFFSMAPVRKLSKMSIMKTASLKRSQTYQPVSQRCERGMKAARTGVAKEAVRMSRTRPKSHDRRCVEKGCSTRGLRGLDTISTRDTWPSLRAGAGSSSSSSANPTILRLAMTCAIACVAMVDRRIELCRVRSKRSARRDARDMNGLRVGADGKLMPTLGRRPKATPSPSPPLGTGITSGGISSSSSGSTEGEPPLAMLDSRFLARSSRSDVHRTESWRESRGMSSALGGPAVPSMI